jgi:transcriptional regulator with XRE-family HTH domain
MAAGLSRAELAEIVGCSESAIVTYELGTRTPRAGTRLNYAEALRDLKQYLADAG